jgi:hypothetical protein
MLLCNPDDLPSDFCALRELAKTKAPESRYTCKTYNASLNVVKVMHWVNSRSGIAQCRKIIDEEMCKDVEQLDRFWVDGWLWPSKEWWPNIRFAKGLLHTVIGKGDVRLV